MESKHQKRVLDLVSRHFQRDAGGFDMDEDIFECLGLDSLQALDFLSKLEGEFGVTIPDSRLKDIRTFRSLVEITACN